ncbi:MAG: hypothetical protein ACRCYE_04715 [Sarcina sp.]
MGKKYLYKFFIIIDLVIFYFMVTSNNGKIIDILFVVGILCMFVTYIAQKYAKF